MKKVLIIGLDPWTIDFSSPEIPLGLTAEKVKIGTDSAIEQLQSLGYDTGLHLIDANVADLSSLQKQLHDESYDGIVIGNGIRSMKGYFSLFENVVNVVHANAPSAKMIFNTSPTDIDAAVARWL